MNYRHYSDGHEDRGIERERVHSYFPKCMEMNGKADQGDQ